MKIFSVVIFLCLNDGTELKGFNLDYTDHLLNDLDRHCLYYSAHQKDDPVFQILEYCIRFQLNESRAYRENYESSFTFDDLARLNVSSRDLVRWSASVDLIEHYQSYLEDPNDSFNELIFYNCSFPWFGSHCQYTFDRLESSFVEQLEISFQRKRLYFHVQQRISCYIHLECNLGTCLDWREICDGKIDCLDTGVDEDQCWQLETNECDDETEYRCHIGLCIAREFFNDEPNHADCLDQSDQGFTGVMAFQQGSALDQTNEDLVKPIFRFEEHMCYSFDRKLYGIECGYLACVSIHEDSCLNGKTLAIRRALFKGANLSFDCSNAIQCLINMQLIDTKFYFQLCTMDKLVTHVENVHNHCPAVIRLPPIMFGHVQFIYVSHRSWNLNMTSFGALKNAPDYICYNAKLCDDALFSMSSPSPTDLFDDNSTCRSFDDLGISLAEMTYSAYITDAIYRLFRRCSISEQSYRVSTTSDLYTCMNSSKTISKHRLVDLVEDCLHGDDEIYTDSCSLDPRNHRLQCVMKNTSVCLAPVLINSINLPCDKTVNEVPFSELEPQPNSTMSMPFANMCDGFPEISPVLIDGRYETDETECHFYPCNNLYTRCDGIWNCLNGADEMNCEWPPMCPSKHHLCLSLITGNLTCLPINRINDSVIDCLGASDELGVCRNQCTSRFCPSYRCANTSTCMTSHSLCKKGSSQCSMITDLPNSLCGEIAELTMWKCLRAITVTRIQDFVCKLDGFSKLSAPLPYLSLTVPTFYYYPSQHNSETNITTTSTRKTSLAMTLVNRWKAWHCDRGIFLYRALGGSNNPEVLCLCPSGYYGFSCEHQDQRVSLTVQVKVSSNWNTVFAFLITLRDDQQAMIESSKQFYYLPISDCRKKFNFHLLYTTRPKMSSVNYTVHIDVYQKQTLEYYASWVFPIMFSFLPVYRMGVQLRIPTVRMVAQQMCEELNCGLHGQCFQSINRKDWICRCHSGWTGKSCHIPYICHCSPDSLCLGPNICLCRDGKLGSRCYLKHLECPCENGGTCMHNAKDLSEEDVFYCVCPKGYSGLRCEKSDWAIVVSFASDMEIPFSVRLHTLEVFGKMKSPIRTTVFKKIPLDQETVTIFRSDPFHLVFAEIGYREYHLTILQPTLNAVSTVSSKLTRANRCPFIAELFNASLVQMHYLRRMKFYHIPCKERKDLACFYDLSHMCICNSDLEQANCFPFEHKTIYTCQEPNICNNNGHCFQEDPACPSPFVCVCNECSYGSRCQFSSDNFVLSLNIILGHQIRALFSFVQQRLAMKIITVVMILMIICGLTSSISCILAFQGKRVRQLDSGKYLFVSSCVSIIVIVIFALKFIILFLSQMGLIVNRMYLLLNCRTMDFVLKTSMNTVDWLHACVAIDRTLLATNETNFNQAKSRRITKWIIMGIFVITSISHIPDPVSRRLVDDEEENRIWCILDFSPSLRTVNYVVLILHFLVPFLINIISALLIIFKVTRRRSVTQKQQPYQLHLRRQVYKFKHLLISPIVLGALSLPHLIIAFMSRCMKSFRDPWLFLFGYLISFLPPMLMYIVFVLPSKTYQDQFRETMKRFTRRIRQY